MRIDSHQHFWTYSPEDYPWITDELKALRRSFMPQDLQPELVKHGLDGSIAVQARQSLTESRWLLDLADQSESILAVVGWVDLRSPEIEGQLAEISVRPKMVGVRHVVQDEPDERFMLQPEFLEGIATLKRFDLAYDILIYPNQLPAAIELVRMFPDQPFVLDHIAKPPIKEGTLAPWDAQIRELAKAENLYCKVSGMVTEAAWKQWQPDDFKPFLDVIIEAFGIDRLMFGSDWPVCLLSGEYPEVFELANGHLTQFSEQDQSKFFGENAAKFYGITPKENAARS